MCPKPATIQSCDLSEEGIENPSWCLFFQGVNPKTFTPPEVGCKIPVSILIVVDFPAPLGPMKATRSPSLLISKLRFLMAEIC